MTGDSDIVSKIELEFDRAGRLCRNLLIREPRLSHQQVKKLAHWLYGCLNQRNTIRRRVAERGIGEIGKALKFVEGAFNTVLKIEQEVESRPND